MKELLEQYVLENARLKEQQTMLLYVIGGIMKTYELSEWGEALNRLDTYTPADIKIEEGNVDVTVG